MIVGIDCVRVVLGPFFAVIFSGVKSGGAYEPAFMFSITEGRAVLVHVHGRLVTLGIGVNGRNFFFPGESIVTTAINKYFSRWVSFFNEGENIASGFVDRCAATLEAGICDCDFRAPGCAAIGRAARADVFITPRCDQSSFLGDHNVGEAFSFKEGLDEWFIRSLSIKF